jgi:hypothetical protein
VRITADIKYEGRVDWERGTWLQLLGASLFDDTRRESVLWWSCTSLQTVSLGILVFETNAVRLIAPQLSVLLKEIHAIAPADDDGERSQSKKSCGRGPTNKKTQPLKSSAKRINRALLGWFNCSLKVNGKKLVGSNRFIIFFMVSAFALSLQSQANNVCECLADFYAGMCCK